MTATLLHAVGEPAEQISHFLLCGSHRPGRIAIILEHWIAISFFALRLVAGIQHEEPGIPGEATLTGYLINQPNHFDAVSPQLWIQRRPFAESFSKIQQFKPAHPRCFILIDGNRRIAVTGPCYKIRVVASPDLADGVEWHLVMPKQSLG